jgi:membrane protein YqaA with SNARE-associated domain
VWVVAIAAITPLPYSLSAWAAGAVHMRFATFFAVSLSRVLRVAGALYLIQLGLLTVSG